MTFNINDIKNNFQNEINIISPLKKSFLSHSFLLFL